jgi:outer membrane protein OmpA-like peptidoglycan-associated protein
LPESKPELQKLTKFLEINTALEVEIQGHTDSSGDSLINQKLSEKRANAVVDYLIDSGIDKSRMSSKGFGDKIPVSTNETIDGRRKNRRTTIKIIGN